VKKTVRQQLEERYGDGVMKRISFHQEEHNNEAEIWIATSPFKKNGEPNPPGKNRIGLVSSSDETETKEDILCSIRRIKKAPYGWKHLY